MKFKGDRHDVVLLLCLLLLEILIIDPLSPSDSESLLISSIHHQTVDHKLTLKLIKCLINNSI